MTDIWLVTKLDLRQRFRTTKFKWVLGISLGLVAFISLFPIITSPQYSLSDDFFGITIGAIFDTSYFISVGMASLLAAIWGASAINGDRNNRTLAVLQITPISSSAIIWGKIFSSWIAAMMVPAVSLVIMLPTLFLANFGLIIPRITMLLVSSIVVLTISGLAVYTSSVAKRTAGSLGITFAVLFGLMIGPLIISAYATFMSPRSGAVIETSTLKPEYRRALDDPANSSLSESEMQALKQGAPYPREFCRFEERHSVAPSINLWWLNGINPILLSVGPLGIPVETGKASLEHINLKGFSSLQIMNTTYRYSTAFTNNSDRISSGVYPHDCGGDGVKTLEDLQPAGFVVTGNLITYDWIVALFIYVGMLWVFVWRGSARLKLPYKKLQPGVRIA
ncbi:hypothetical protein BSR28_05085 [Boudabousia liubingyangii]|uniref:ABC transporter permease n=1 Tax=Boudabousia liubingyangii TaxID=1921764 RepID=UPI00093FD45A|nr:ABC transporter permease subunit [Boudabousia liubingyangii]OKL46813.1 hypothetical protein BSR28_05085 [Boudabousia liubingyangii]